METSENVKLATDKQRDFIKVLYRDMGKRIPEIPEDLTAEKASTIIEALLNRVRPHAACEAQNRKPVSKVNEPRLGMSMKECFRLWMANNKDIFGEGREAFKRDVRRTYMLFTEIAEAIERQGMKRPDKSERAVISRKI